MLNDLAAQQGVLNASLDLPERGVELLHVRLAGIPEHGGGLASLRSPTAAPSRLDSRPSRSEKRLLSWAGTLARTPSSFFWRLATFPWRASAAVWLRVWRFCCSYGGELARLHLGERRAHRLDLALGARQTLLEILGELLHDALDLGNRSWVHAQAGREVGDHASVLEGDIAARRGDELVLVLDQVDELLLRRGDRAGDDLLDSGRGKRALSDVLGEPTGCRRDGSGERLRGARKPLPWIWPWTSTVAYSWSTA